MNSIPEKSEEKWYVIEPWRMLVYKGWEKKEISTDRFEEFSER